MSGHTFCALPKSQAVPRQNGAAQKKELTSMRMSLQSLSNSQAMLARFLSPPDNPPWNNAPRSENRKPQFCKRKHLPCILLTLGPYPVRALFAIAIRWNQPRFLVCDRVFIETSQNQVVSRMFCHFKSVSNKHRAKAPLQNSAD